MSLWIIYTVVGRIFIMGLIGWELIKRWRNHAD
jgi:hypothetical protein